MYKYTYMYVCIFIYTYIRICMYVKEIEMFKNKMHHK